MAPKITVPQEHPHAKPLTNLLHQFASRHEVTKVFMNRHFIDQEKYLIVIYLNTARVEKRVFESPWIKRVHRNYNTEIILLGVADVRRHERMGSLFMTRNCTTEHLIYEKEACAAPKTNRRRDLKRFRKLKQNYYRYHDDKTMMINKAYEAGSLITLFHLYLHQYAHHLWHMEFLYTGRTFDDENLHERLIRLEDYFPEIKRMLLKKNATTYFVIEALYSVEKADEHNDSMYVTQEYVNAIAHIESAIYDLLQKVFQKVKNAVKLSATPINKAEIVESKAEHEAVVAIIQRYFAIDEVFIYHQKEMDTPERKVSIFYMLLISSSISNQDLHGMMQLVEQQTNGCCHIVPIAHSAPWIQEHLYEYQEFFQRIMKREYTVFCAEHPTVIHWQEPYKASYPDLILYQKQTKDLYESYLALRKHEGENLSAGALLVFSALIPRLCRDLIYAKLSYRPNDIDLKILWALCAYAQPEHEKLCYLIDQLPFDFFSFMNVKKQIYSGWSFVDVEVFEILDALVLRLCDFGIEPL